MTTSSLHRIVIIGCGYVGTAVGRELAAIGHDVIATTTSPSRLDELRRIGLTACQLELTDVNKLRSVLVDRDVALLTYGAGRHGDYNRVYLQGAHSIVAAARSTSIQRIIYTSSTRVYHQQDGSWVDETSPTNPSDPKGQALVEAERVLLNGLAHAQPPTATMTVLRLGGIHGPTRSLTDRILTCAGQQRHDGQGYVNLIHVDDIVTAMVKLVCTNYHGVLNLTNDDPMIRHQLYDTILARAKMKPIHWTDHNQPSRGKRVCNKRIKHVLQLSLSRSFA